MNEKSRKSFRLKRNAVAKKVEIFFDCNEMNDGEATAIVAVQMRKVKKMIVIIKTKRIVKKKNLE